MDISDVNVLFPVMIDWKKFEKYKPLEPFDDEVMEFLSALSASLLKDKESRLYPDVITFAFFCRIGNLKKLKEQYKGDSLRLGRGIVFHIGPSNVPINFAYSLVAGLLAGNYNVVRCSNKDFPQVDIVVKHLAVASESAPSVGKRIAVVKYGHESQANDYFSSIAQVRVIWGGDETIYRLRLSKTQARCFDIAFADRYSFAVINADKLVSENNLLQLAENFYNDTYLFDQNACSAPHLVIWLGSKENVDKSKDMFWKAEYDMVQKKQYHFQSVMAVDKLTDFYRQSQVMSISLTPTKDNELVRVQICKLLPTCIDEYRSKCGYFTEYDAKSLDEVAPIVKYKYQTMACYGIDDADIKNFILRNHLIGIDRFVPFGKTTAFSLTWDGYNLINMLSREVTIMN
jgi:hypothetical protein